jgi:hypothetical protein
MLLISGLQQRLLSSIEAFARTLRVHRKTVRRHWYAAQAAEAAQADQGAQATQAAPTWDRPPDLDLLNASVDSDDDRAALSEEEIRSEEDSQVESATAATAGPTGTPDARALFAQEQKLLDEMTEIAEAARGLPDARVRLLVDSIGAHMCPRPGDVCIGASTFETDKCITCVSRTSRNTQAARCPVALFATSTCSHYRRLAYTWRP